MVRHPLFLSLLSAALVASCTTPVTTKAPPRPALGSKKPITPVTDPNGLVAGAGLISDKGLGLISNNGGGLIGKVKIPTGLVANNSGSLIANNGGGIISDNGGSLISDKGLGYTVLALDEKPLVGFKVTIVDAEGRAIPDAAGKPYQAVTDEAGNYSFKTTPRGLNLLVKVELPEAVGPMFAYLPDAAADAPREAAVDGVSTLVVGYILDRYVKGSLDTLQKLPAQAEADTRAKALAAVGETLDLPNFKPAEVVKAVDGLRAKDPGFDAQVKYVESLLAAGLKDAGDGLAATQVALTYPTGLARLADGSFLISERNGYRVRRVWPNGTITSFAGKDGAKALGDGGPAGEAWLDRPTGVAVDSQGNVYVSDFGHDRLRKIDAKTGVITTVAGTGSESSIFKVLFDTTPALETHIGSPKALAVDAQDRPVFRCASGLFRLEKDGRLSLLGTGDDNPPQNLTTGPDGKVYAYHHDTGEVFTVEEDRLAPVPGFQAVPANDERAGVAVAPDGAIYITRGDKVFRHHNGTFTELPKGENINTLGVPLVVGSDLYMLEPEGGRLWKTPLLGGAFTLVAGLPLERADGIKAENLALNRPSGLVFDPQGNLYVADGGAAVVWQRRKDGLYYRFAGSIEAIGNQTEVGDGGPARDARLGKVVSLTSRPDGRILLADLQLPATVIRLREIALDGTITSLKMPEGKIVAPALCAVEADGGLLVSDYLLKSVWRLKGETAEEIIPAGRLERPSALLALPDGSFYVCDTDGSAVYHVVGKTLTKVVGGNGEGFGGDGGPALAAKLNRPLGLLADAAGNLYISDSRNDRIRRVNKATGTIETIAGAGGRTLSGSGIDDSLKEPLGMAFDPEGHLYITDSAHNQIKVIKADVLK